MIFKIKLLLLFFPSENRPSRCKVKNFHGQLYVYMCNFKFCKIKEIQRKQIKFQLKGTPILTWTVSKIFQKQVFSLMYMIFMFNAHLVYLKYILMFQNIDEKLHIT